MATTVFTTQTQYNCTLGATTATSTVSSTYFSNEVYTLVSVAVHVTETSPPSCDWFFDCSSLKPNADVAGLGVITSSLVSAYTFLGLLLWCYWYGLLPRTLFRRVDSRLFSANSRNAQSRWKKIIEETTLIISDQQLITGLAILTAGYVQVFFYDLSVYHWTIVIYLAWISSTVHLMTLSLLREKLNANPLLRNFRLCLMLCTLLLLIVGLVPTVTDAWRSATYISWYSGKPVSVSVPARCFFDSQAQPAIISGPTTMINIFEDVDTIITFVPLILTYAWKLSQLFNQSQEWIRFWGRGRAEAAMEGLARRILRYPARNIISRILMWTFYKSVIRIYVLYVLGAELLESFMATIFSLMFILVWGTVRLLKPRITWADQSTQTGELEMGFGQILALLLLLQPAIGMLQVFLEKENNYDDENVVLYGAGNENTIRRSTTMATTLAAALGSDNIQLLSPQEKAKGGQIDPIIEHIYMSRVFKLSLWVTFTASLGFLVIASTFWSITSEVTDMRIYLIGYIFLPLLGFNVLVISCSRKLS